MSKRKMMLFYSPVLCFKSTLLNCESISVLQLKPKNKIYKIDELFTSRGHSVIRLPPYMCELNPIEMAWAKIKRLLKERNVNGDISTAKLLDLTNWAITHVTTEDWMGYCSHVTKIESEYWERDGIVPDIIDSIVINMDSDNECEESKNSDSSSMDSD
ncbi:Uncharacterized protein GBIM_19437 [Gryllus bimaculatus]|nr:Uncharacterized protein GBIM_19437 [Gryllus bimaculatus]